MKTNDEKPTVKIGNAAVDPDKCPTLHRSLLKGRAHFENGWNRVLELRKIGKGKRLTRKLLGIKPKRKMPDEVKAHWRGEKGGEEE